MSDAPRASDAAERDRESGARRRESQSKLSPAAQRALSEADARRARRAAPSRAEEVGGRGGLDPARFGDWEVKGLASDF